MIELTHVSKYFQQHCALADINLFIQEGEIFGIIGKSGAGKSTLLRCLNRLETPDSGEITIDQRNILALTPKELRHLRHTIGMIFQHFNLLQSKTVYENIALPLRIQGVDETSIQTKINELLQLVELDTKAHAYPSELSGGQKQRVAIARALSSSPKILLCDEATSALDPQTTDAILALLKKINLLYGITIVLITHEMHVIKQICHRVALIEQGSVLETQTLATVFQEKDSAIKNMLYQSLSPNLPDCLQNSLTSEQNHHPVLKLFFQGDAENIPFISETSRALGININILVANIDRIEGRTFGILLVQLEADLYLQSQFMKRAHEQGLTVEMIGYVYDNCL